MKLDPRHLVQLSMIVEAGSFQAAADRLSMTQPSLSRNIKQLESRVGAPLFDRSTRRAIPTELGLRLAQNGLTIRIAEEQASAYSDLAAIGSAGELKIGAPPIIADHFLSRRISRFVRENPECHVELRVGLVHELRTMLERTQIDLVVGPRNLAEHVDEFSFAPLVDERIGIICRAGHPLLSARSIGPRELERHSWIAHSRGSTLRLQTEGALVAMGLEKIRIAVETDSIHSVLEIVESTDLISTMPREATQGHMHEKLTFLDVDHPQFARPMGIIRRISASQSSVTRKFVDLLRHG
ncbi:MAG: LysR family transcriptional regulator [Rhodobacteraceae bacterium]|jgi:DNA-binding transcriptional LysR family regulator|nr:LysR family transcriptional regulator [Paracoccaceae bacterium]